jgi:hypothetical protein
MSSIKGRRPSASIIVAVVALVAALGSSAVAGVTISKLSNKEKKQVKRLSKKQARKLDKRIELLPGPQGEQGLTGPTEGSSTGRAIPGRRADAVPPESFQTTQTGRVLVIMPVRGLIAACTSGTEYRAWIEVDNIPLPGSVIGRLPANGDATNLTFAGVTPDSIKAGQHAAKIAVKCEVTGATTFGAATADRTGVSFVVLGGAARGG